MPVYAELAQPSRSSVLTRPRALGGLVAMTCAVIAAWVLPRWTDVERTHSFATGHGEQRDILLDDGSKITLNVESSLDVMFTSAERRVRLGRGEGYFDVAKDPSARPFVVDAGLTEVRVTGTRFSVRSSASSTDVIVAEGKVEVIPDKRGQSPATPAKVELVPGNALRFDRRESYIHVAAIDTEAATAWRTGTIRFDNATVEDVIAEVNRYSSTPLVIESPDRVRDIRMSGAFRVGDTDAVRFVLKNGYGVESSAREGKIVLR